MDTSAHGLFVIIFSSFANRRWILGMDFVSGGSGGGKRDTETEGVLLIHDHRSERMFQSIREHAVIRLTSVVLD